MIRVNHQNKIIELNLSYNIKPKYFPLIFVLNTPLTPYLITTLLHEIIKLTKLFLKFSILKVQR